VYAAQNRGKFPPRNTYERSYKKCDTPSLLLAVSPKVRERKQEVSNLLLAIMSAHRGPKDLNKQ
jgi:hypothetical protein